MAGSRIDRWGENRQGDRSKGVRKHLQVFHQALGVTGPQGPAANGCFSWGFSSQAACSNLEDDVYSWGRDKPAALAPAPSEQSGHYQRTKEECCTATSIWF